MNRTLIAIILIVSMSLACGGNVTPDIPPTPQYSIFDTTETAYGFFPSPPEVTLESVFKTFEDMGKHGDFVLIQQNIKWNDFLSSVDGESTVDSGYDLAIVLRSRSGE